MKKILKWLMLLLCIIAPVALASCGDDDDDDGINDSSSIVGIWSDDGTDDWYGEGGDAYGYKFTANGRYFEYGSGRSTGRYFIEGNSTLVFEDEDGNDTDEYRFRIKGNKLYLRWYDSDYDEYEDEEVYYRVR